MLAARPVESANLHYELGRKNFLGDTPHATYFQVIKEVLDQLYEDLPAENRDSQIQTSLTVPKPQTSGAKSDGRFGKQDFVYLPVEDAYRHTELAPQRL